MFKVRGQVKMSDSDCKVGNKRKKRKELVIKERKENAIVGLSESSNSLRSSEESKENTNVKVHEIISLCKTLGIKFEDDEFPASVSSLVRLTDDTINSCVYRDGFGKSVVAWERPQNIRTKGKDSSWVVIKDPCPSDICQGRLGNCWFIAALALIAERADLIARVLPSEQMNPFGVYNVWLFMDGNWKDVIVDDRLPCDSFHRLVFSSCRRNQLWVPLIEKAMAKLHGSYESLQCGTLWDGLNYLTGFVSERIELKLEEDREFLWGRLLSFQSCGFLMGATINTSTQLELYLDDVGLVENHVYSVLKIASSGGQRFLQLRNPWGKFSWKGQSNLPSTENFKDDMQSPYKSMDGVFWMSYSNFLRYFTCIEVCKIRKDWDAHTLFGILPPYSDKDCQPCFEIVCKTSCEVDISVYQNCKRNQHEKLKLTDIGLLIFETNGNSAENFRLVEAIELVPSTRKRCVTCSLMLTAGKYCVIPFSFGHWTTNQSNELFYGITLSVYSSNKIACSIARPANIDTILSDAFMLCAKKFGKKRRYSLKDKYNDIYVVTLSIGSSHCAAVFNHSSKYAEIGLEYKTRDYKNTRGSLKTCDLIPPNHGQVIQVLTSKEGKSSKMTFSHYIRVVPDLDPGKSAHPVNQPPIMSRNAGLHLPRPVA